MPDSGLYFSVDIFERTSPGDTPASTDSALGTAFVVTKLMYSATFASLLLCWVVVLGYLDI